MSLLLDQLLGELNFLFGILIGQLGGLIFPLSTFFYPQTVTELKEAIGNVMTNIGAEVMKAVINSVRIRAQDCIYQEVTTWKMW